MSFHNDNNINNNENDACYSYITKNKRVNEKYISMHLFTVYACYDFYNNMKYSIPSMVKS